jgi:hypothetical protein
MTELALQSVQQQCRLLRLPAVAEQCGPLAQTAEREQQPYLGYLGTLFAGELEEREQHTVVRGAVAEEQDGQHRLSFPDRIALTRPDGNCGYRFPEVLIPHFDVDPTARCVDTNQGI